MTDARERIEEIRSSYELASLSEEGLAPTWLEQFEDWLEAALASGAPEPNAMVLATADAGGAPGARAVLLRGVDGGGFRFHTDYRSRKAREIEANPRATLVFPWFHQQRQVTVDGDVERLDGEESDAYFATRPPRSRISAVASVQSQPIESRQWLERRFEAVAREHGGGGDVPRPEHWGGYLVVPHAVEFWQGRRDRLHDRIRYRRTEGGAWVVERLAP